MEVMRECGKLSFSGVRDLLLPGCWSLRSGTHARSQLYGLQRHDPVHLRVLRRGAWWGGLAAVSGATLTHSCALRVPPATSNREIAYARGTFGCDTFFFAYSCGLTTKR